MFALALNKEPVEKTKEEERQEIKKENKLKKVQGRNQNRLDMKKSFINYLKNLENKCSDLNHTNHQNHGGAPEQGHGLTHNESTIRV